MRSGDADERAAGEGRAPGPLNGPGPAATPARARLRGSIAAARPELLLAAALLFSFLYFFPKPGWNQNSRLDLVRAIVEQRSFAIDAFHLNTGDKAIVAGRFLSDKAPGASFVAVIPYALYHAWATATGRPLPRARVTFARGFSASSLTRQDRIEVNWAFIAALYLCGLFAAAIPGVVTGVLLARYCRTFEPSPRRAILCSAVFSLGTIAFPYSTAFYGHQLAAACLFGAFFLARRAAARALTPAELYAVGALLACGGISEYPAALATLPIVGYLLGRRCGPGGLARVGAGAAPLLALHGNYAWRAFGRPWALGYGHLANPTFAGPQSEGFFGLSYPRLAALHGTLFGRHRGLLYVSPVLALAPWGWARSWQRHPGRRVELALCAAIALYFVLLNASYFMWTGGAASGPRHVVPMLPFLCVGLASLLHGRARWLVGAMALPSATNVLALTAAGVAAPERGDLLRDYAWPVVLGRLDVPRLNLGSALGLPTPLCLLPLLAIWACTAVAVRWSSASEEAQQRGTRAS